MCQRAPIGLLSERQLRGNATKRAKVLRQWVARLKECLCPSNFPPSLTRRRNFPDGSIRNLILGQLWQLFFIDVLKLLNALVFRSPAGNARRLIARVLCQRQHPIVRDRRGSGRCSSRCVPVRRLPLGNSLALATSGNLANRSATTIAPIAIQRVTGAPKAGQSFPMQSSFSGREVKPLVASRQ